MTVIKEKRYRYGYEFKTSGLLDIKLLVHDEAIKIDAKIKISVKSVIASV